MVILNFSHPLTPDQRAQVERLTGVRIEEVVNVPVQFDHYSPFQEQLRDTLNLIDFRAIREQPLIVVMPSLSIIAAMVTVALYDRLGYFPAVLRLRPVKDALPPKYEVAEIVFLHGMETGEG